MNKPAFAEVLLEVSIKKALDYAIPEELSQRAIVGAQVEVPMRGRLVPGYIVKVKQHSSFPNPLSINKVVSDGAVLTKELFDLALWISQYYHTPLERTVKTMLPAGVRKGTETKTQFFVTRNKTREELSLLYRELGPKAPQQAKALEILIKARKGMLFTELLEQAECPASSLKALAEKGYILLERVRTDRSLLVGEEYFKTKPKLLREEQKIALHSILHSLEKGTFSVKLLHGVTGSGKTEVYIRAIETCLSMNKTALVLVPEISLTTQTIQRFKCRFDCEIAVLHHRLSDGERHEAWTKIREGKCPIVIGARSSIFSPLPNLGLIIVDEEHELSYKQEDDSPTYHARDLAVMRGKLSSATVVLGSATPSLESYYNVERGKYELIVLKERGKNITLPKVHIVDMKEEFNKVHGLTSFSELLLSKIHEKSEKGEQTILFLNRRGYHTTTGCKSCGKTIMCQRCDSSLTLHKSTNHLHCHLCGYETLAPTRCPFCNQESMVRYQGVGTEKIEAMLSKILPNVRILRADADSTRHKGSLEQILNAFKSGKADVLIGTQMIAKGLHFSEVTLVGVLNCDTTLQIPDFRAQETVFQLITQVAGRSGRGYLPGEVVLQTTLPDHPIIQAASRQDYEAFFKEEISIRKIFGYPPFTHFVKMIFQGTDQALVEHSSCEWTALLQKELPQNYICHPALPCGHAKVKDLYRYQCLVRGSNPLVITKCIEAADKQMRLPKEVQRYIDVDPSSTFF